MKRMIYINTYDLNDLLHMKRRFKRGMSCSKYPQKRIKLLEGFAVGGGTGALLLQPKPRFGSVCMIMNTFPD